MSGGQQRINGETLWFGIIGNPVHHTLSPLLHNASFAALGMNCVYVPLPTTGLAEGVAGLEALGFKGLSVKILNCLNNLATSLKFKTYNDDFKCNIE